MAINGSNDLNNIMNPMVQMRKKSTAEEEMSLVTQIAESCSL